MSYDFLLMPRHPGQSWRELLDASEQRILEQGDSPLSPAARARLEQIAERLQAHDPQLERFTTEQHIELTRAGDSGIQVSLFPGEAAVAVAYWHTGHAARAVMQIVWAYLVILEQETGWEIYDAQLGRSLNRGQNLDEVTGWYADVTARLRKRFPGALRPPAEGAVERVMSPASGRDGPMATTPTGARVLPVPQTFDSANAVTTRGHPACQH